MAQTAANLVDHVLPIAPLRQFVITLPFGLRARLVYDGKLCGAVTRIAIDSVLGLYKRLLEHVDNEAFKLRREATRACRLRLAGKVQACFGERPHETRLIFSPTTNPIPVALPDK